MYVYLMYHCITAVECNSSSTTAVHYTMYYYYTTAAVFAVCTYVIHRSPAAARPPPILLVIHGYTQQLCQVLLILYLTWLLLILRSALRYTYDMVPLPICITFLLAHRRSPAATLLLVVHSFTQQYIFVGTLVAAPPQGVTRE